GGFDVGRARSDRVASVTPTAMPAAATAAAPTASQTRRRGLIRSDGIRATNAIFRKAMPTYRELLQQVRAEISEVDAWRARELVAPESMYLAAAGVGRIGIVDADVVDESNLQRQIVHSTERLGEPKVESAKRTIEALNPDVQVVAYQERLTSENVERILADGWDVIVDGADNFPTRYLVNDASVWHGIPVVHGSIYRFEGQVTVFKPGAGPC